VEKAGVAERIGELEAFLQPWHEALRDPEAAQEATLRRLLHSSRSSSVEASMPICTMRLPARRIRGRRSR